MIASGQLTVVEQRHGSSHVDVYKDRLEMVLAEVNRGSLAGLVGHGSSEHLEALRTVQRAVAEIIHHAELLRAEPEDE